jgi:hypothetical protein
MYGSSYMFRHYIAILRERSQCLLRDAQLRCTTSLNTTRPSQYIIDCTQLSISQKALGTLPEVGNVMLKRVGATIHN